METAQPPTTAMFGLIVAGRMVHSTFTLASPGKFLTSIQQPESVNHIVLFMTGVEPFPAGYGGQIYFSCPDPTAVAQQEAPWHYLGFISNEKPSAVFKVGGLKQKNSVIGPFQQQFPTTSMMMTGTGLVAQLGISIETLDSIYQSTPAPSATPTLDPTFREFPRRMLEHFYNYITSFGAGNVTMDLVRKWYDTVMRRMEADPNWWR